MKQLTLKVKKEVSERAMRNWNTNTWCCENCGYIHELHFHHIIHKGMGGTRRRYTAENVKLLCRKCHAKEHGIREV